MDVNVVESPNHPECTDVANVSKHVLQTHFVINTDLVIKSNVRETCA